MDVFVLKAHQTKLFGFPLPRMLGQYHSVCRANLTFLSLTLSLAVMRLARLSYKITLKNSSFSLQQKNVPEEFYSGLLLIVEIL